MAASPTRILLIGGTGTGKTSVAACLLYGDVSNVPSDKEALLRVSDSARGVTFDFAAMQHEDLVVSDTVGIGEGEEGTVPTVEAFQKLRKFLQENKEGFNIILFVFKAPRIRLADTQTFKMFYDVIFPDMRDYFHIVITGTDQNPNWPQENRNAVSSSFKGLSVERGIGGCFAHAPQNEKWEAVFKPSRLDSTHRLKAYIEKAKKPLKVPDAALHSDDLNGFARLVTNIVRFFFPVWGGFRTKLVEMLTNLGLSLDDARVLAEGS